MIIKVFDRKYIDLSKVVSMELVHSGIFTSLIDTIEFNIQLLDKPLYICHKDSEFMISNDKIEQEAEIEFNRVLKLWEYTTKIRNI